MKNLLLIFVLLLFASCDKEANIIQKPFQGTFVHEQEYERFQTGHASRYRRWIFNKTLIKDQVLSHNAQQSSYCRQDCSDWYVKNERIYASPCFCSCQNNAKCGEVFQDIIIYSDTKIKIGVDVLIKL